MIQELEGRIIDWKISEMEAGLGDGMAMHHNIIEVYSTHNQQIGKRTL